MRKIKVLVTAAFLMASMSITAFAGEWKQDLTGWWYQNDDGSYPVNVLKQIDGQWYYFDSTGYMKTGNFQFESGWLNFRDDGGCSNPISQITGEPVGAPREGWVRCGVSLAEAVDRILDGDIIWHNDLCWISPERFNNLKELSENDVVVRKPSNTLKPGSYIDFSSSTYYEDDCDDEDYDEEDFDN